MNLAPTQKRLLYLFFFISGACALTYEILWTKYLSLSFGTTMPAVSIVAATFMGGLALGSYLIGLYADRHRNLLVLYAVLEAGIALFALLSLPGLDLVTALHLSIERLLPEHPLFTHAIHFCTGALLLVPPTVCMGGTFPLMCRFFARQKSGGQIGRLYALNTLGATIGAFGCAFVLVPAIGLSTTLFIAVALNLVISAASWRLSKLPGTATNPVDVSAATRPEQPLRARQHWLPLLAIGLTGFFSLAYEILWTRILLLFLGNTTYAFALILCTFLVGLTLGGAIYARRVHPAIDERKVMIQLTMLMGLTILVTAPFYDRLALVFQQLHELCGENWWLLSFLSIGVVFATIGLPTILSGSLLPAAVAMLDPGRVRTGQGVGLVVLANTGGAVFGSLVAAFGLVPWLGLQSSFMLLGSLNLLLAGVLLLRLRPGGHLRWLVPALTAVGLAVTVMPWEWDAPLMNSGVYVYAPKYTQMGGLRKVLGLERIVEVIEGRDATVAIHENMDGSMRFFTVNGKTDGGNGRDMSTQLLVGHLPMLLHRQPDDVLVIGLGTGITLRGLGGYGPRGIDCVEISPEVVQASRYFAENNGHALDDPKVRLIIEDGRNLLLTQTKPYDVIISEPSNPWQSGNANLFTLDFYRLAASRLKPGGVFCQWLGLYDITPDNLRIALNTFLRVFPRAMTFRSGTDLILVGSEQDLTIDYQLVRSRMQHPQIRAAMEEFELVSTGCLLARHYLYNEGPLLELSRDSELNTDDKPVLEYSARHIIGEKTLGTFQQANMAQLLQVRGKVTLPLVNLGRTPAEVAVALRELAFGFQRANRSAEADYLLRTAAGLEAQVQPPQPASLPAG